MESNLNPGYYIVLDRRFRGKQMVLSSVDINDRGDLSLTWVTDRQRSPLCYATRHLASQARHDWGLMYETGTYLHIGEEWFQVFTSDVHGTPRNDERDKLLKEYAPTAS